MAKIPPTKNSIRDMSQIVSLLPMYDMKKNPVKNTPSMPPADQANDKIPYLLPIFEKSSANFLSIMGWISPIANVGSKNKYNDKYKFNFNIESDEFIIKSVFSASIGIKKTNIDEIKNDKGSDLFPSVLSAILPPI
jgi:hypothetical protein